MWPCSVTSCAKPRSPRSAPLACSRRNDQYVATHRRNVGTTRGRALRDVVQLNCPYACCSEEALVGRNGEAVRLLCVGFHRQRTVLIASARYELLRRRPACSAASSGERKGQNAHGLASGWSGCRCPTMLPSICGRIVRVGVSTSCLQRCAAHESPVLPEVVERCGATTRRPLQPQTSWRIETHRIVPS